MAETVEIYGLFDPISGEPRYIGKANNAAKRLKGHYRECRRRNTPLYCWMRKLFSEGKAPVLKVLESWPEDDWKNREIAWIDAARTRYGRSILNAADGGDQPLCPASILSANARRNVAGMLLKRSATPEAKRLFDAKRKIGIWLARGRVSEVNKEKLRYCARKAPHLFGLWANIT